MAKVILHRSSDGTLHETQTACAKHEVKLRIAPQVEKLVSEVPKFVCDGGTFEADDRGNACLFEENIPAFVVANADALRKILNDALVAKRARKPKAAKSDKPVVAV
jgi:hypothetical protein